uniref:Uncharacterized protein n=1 Tax=Prolemur simus TaxID=1328070 RepID=A0A8C9A4C9_PROSS
MLRYCWSTSCRGAARQPHWRRAEGRHRQTLGPPTRRPCCHAAPGQLVHMQNLPFEPTSVDGIWCRGCPLTACPGQGGQEVHSAGVTAAGRLGITVDQLTGFTSHWWCPVFDWPVLAAVGHPHPLCALVWGT